MVSDDRDLEYWRGTVDTSLKSIATTLERTDANIARMADKIDSLRLWKAKVAGVAMAASAVGALIIRVAEAWVKGN